MASSASLLVLLVILLTVGAILLVDARPPENKIIGGKPIDIKNVPWQVSLRVIIKNIPTLCGGNILNDRWILTAAHCTYGVRASDVTVRAGSSSRSQGGTQYKVVDVVNHPEYGGNFHNDIALLKTATPIVFRGAVAKAVLPKARAPLPPPGTPVLVTGWGLTVNDNTTDGSDHLMSVEVQMVQFEQCRRTFPEFAEPFHICAGFPGRDSCRGDSGGPLVAKGVVIGISSFGGKICGDQPSVYTKVATYVDWIEAHTRH